MRLREIIVAMNLVGLVLISASGQTSETKKKLDPDVILNRRVAECITQVQSDDPDECIHIENITIGGLLLDSFSGQRIPIPVGIALPANDDGNARFHFKPLGLSVQDVLNSIVAADPRYRWSLEDSVVNLVPVSGTALLLDTRLAEFKKDNANTESLFKALENMPEVRQRAAELGLDGPQSTVIRIGLVDTRKFAVHCQQCSVRDVLNEIVCQNGDSWMYREFNNNSKRTYRFWYISP